MGVIALAEGDGSSANYGLYISASASVMLHGGPLRRYRTLSTRGRPDEQEIAVFNQRHLDVVRTSLEEPWMATVAEPERVDVAYSLIVDPETERILIVGYRNGGWSLPGGAREPGETLAETAIRETMEEAGVAVAVERLVAVNERFPEPHAVFFVFYARIIGGTPTVTDDEEIVRFKWVDAQEANDLLPYWQMDFALHNEYRAFYCAAEWEDRD